MEKVLRALEASGAFASKVVLWRRQSRPHDLAPGFTWSAHWWWDDEEYGHSVQDSDNGEHDLLLLVRKAIEDRESKS